MKGLKLISKNSILTLYNGLLGQLITQNVSIELFIHLPSTGDDNPVRCMIMSLCSSSELMECFCKISEPASVRTTKSGLFGQSLKLV